MKDNGQGRGPLPFASMFSSVHYRVREQDIVHRLGTQLDSTMARPLTTTTRNPMLSAVDPRSCTTVISFLNIQAGNPRSPNFISPSRSSFFAQSNPSVGEQASSRHERIVSTIRQVPTKLHMCYTGRLGWVYDEGSAAGQRRHSRDDGLLAPGAAVSAWISLGH